MSERDGGPAFPTKAMVRVWSKEAMQAMNAPDSSAFALADCAGMSLRDYFAAHAMAGALGGTPGQHLTPERVARDSYAYADALITEREKNR